MGRPSRPSYESWINQNRSGLDRWGRRSEEERGWKTPEKEAPSQTTAVAIGQSSQDGTTSSIITDMATGMPVGLMGEPKKPPAVVKPPRQSILPSKPGELPERPAEVVKPPVQSILPSKPPELPEQPPAVVKPPVQSILPERPAELPERPPESEVEVSEGPRGSNEGRPSTDVFGNTVVLSGQALTDSNDALTDSYNDTLTDSYEESTDQDQRGWNSRERTGVNSSTEGGGFSRKRIGVNSRKQTNLTGSRGISILTS